MNGMNGGVGGQVGGGMGGGGLPAQAGYASELGYIYAMVEDLSRQLAENKRVLDDVVTGVGRVRSRARVAQIGNEELIEGAAEEIQSQEANLDATISVLTEALDAATQARDANAALLAQYANVLAEMLKQAHEFKQKHVSDVAAWHRSYRHQLAEARAENSRLREQIWKMQERAGNANAALRRFRSAYDADPVRWERRVADKALRQELRFWKRLAMPGLAEAAGAPADLIARLSRDDDDDDEDDDNDDDLGLWSDDDDLIDPVEKMRLERKAAEEHQLQQEQQQHQQQHYHYQQQQQQQQQQEQQQRQQQQQQSLQMQQSLQLQQQQLQQQQLQLQQQQRQQLAAAAAAAAASVSVPASADGAPSSSSTTLHSVTDQDDSDKSRADSVRITATERCVAAADDDEDDEGADDDDDDDADDGIDDVVDDDSPEAEAGLLPPVPQAPTSAPPPSIISRMTAGGAAGMARTAALAAAPAAEPEVDTRTASATLESADEAAE